MRRGIALGAALALVAALASCTPPEEYAEKQDTTMMTPEEAMDDIVELWDAAMNAADVDAQLALYNDEGAGAMPPDQPAVMGKEALRTFFEDFHAMGDVTVKDVAESVVAGGGHSVGMGTYTLDIAAEDGTMTSDTGRWLCVNVRQPDGSYKIVRNIWNRDAPPPGAPAPAPVAETGPEPAADAACYDSPKALDMGFEADLEAGNAAALVAAHTEDGARIPPGMPAQIGRANVARYIASRLEPYSERQLDLTDINEMTDENLGVTTGRFKFDYTPKAGGDQVTGEGKYMAVSKKGDDGCWRLHWVLWNADAPPAGMES